MTGLQAAALAGLLAMTGAPATAQTLTLTGLGGETSQLTAADIAALPHQPITLSLEGGKTAACDGVALSLLLAKVGAPQGKALRGPEMADVVEIRAADGYRVALALAETDAGMRTNRVLLADRCGGVPIAAPEGPFRLIVEGDLRPARAARQVVAVRVSRLPAP